MSKKIIVQFKFSVEEAAIHAARNKGVILCDANNYSFVNFSGAEIIAGNDTPETAYLVSKAKGEKPKPVVKKTK